MSIGPRGVDFTIGRIYGHRREHIVQSYGHRSVEDQRGGPRLATITAARDKDVVEVRGLSLQDAGLASGVDVIDVMGEAISDNRALGVIEGRFARCGALAYDRITNAPPGKSIVIGTLDVNQSAVARRRR